MWTPAEARQAHEHEAHRPLGPEADAVQAEVLHGHELATVTVLLSTTRGARPTRASPQFMDFMTISHEPQRQIAMRGGLALVDRLSVDSLAKCFVSGTCQVLMAYTSNPVSLKLCDCVLQQFPLT